MLPRIPNDTTSPLERESKGNVNHRPDYERCEEVELYFGHTRDIGRSDPFSATSTSSSFTAASLSASTLPSSLSLLSFSTISRSMFPL